MPLRLYLSALAVAACSIVANGQCLTDFNKLVPEPSLDVTQEFKIISMFDDYLAIGLPANDSLGRLAGIVRIYEKSSDGWKKVATVAPSDPVDALQFGAAVKLSSNYLLVAGGSNSRKVYLFKKSPGGWQSQTELTSFSMPFGTWFGAAYQTQNTMDISSDEQTIAITDLFYDLGEQYRSGAVFVYHKQPVDEWHGAMEPVMIPSPEVDAQDFGRAGVAIRGDRIITGTPFAPTGNGRFYVFRDPSGEFLDMQLEAKLSAGPSNETSWFGMANFAVTQEGIVAPIVVGLNTGDPHTALAFYEFPAFGPWHDSDYSCLTPYHPDLVETRSIPTLATNGTVIVASFGDSDGANGGYTSIVRKGPSGWCDPVREWVETSPLIPGQFVSAYGAVNAINQSEDIVVGSLPHPDLAGTNAALKVLDKNSSGGWDAQLLASDAKSTAGHYYGAAILGFGDLMFVGASRDGTVKPNAGAVYVYKKSGTTWSKSGKIIAPVEDRYDDVFGSALATNGTHLAVGALGFEEHGRVFIYAKNDADWSDPELLQEIELPEDILTVYAYGDNLAMNDEWLLIPYVQNSPARILLAAYKYDGAKWNYDQVVEIGAANIFAKSTTIAVAIEGQTVIAGNTILELDAAGTWRKMYTLSPSDPEPMRISPDFTHWITNGSMFGHSVAISNNTIFIGAPTKDDGSTWDVGAIYVYTKKPWESWSNRTETAKILPRIKSERELFGYSMKALGNTLIAGAPGADYNKNDTPRNKPGRVYIFQSEDYFWQTVTPLLDLTGDSFVKDYFGMSVNLDETDFFISAPIEDLETGKLSGSVYVTPAPPIVKLVPPVCSTTETIDLFGYPFGGVWSGPGLIDAAKGIFDPSVAGTGEHEFTYSTESCTYLGRLRIVVEEPVSPVLLVNQEHFVCQGSSVNIPLSVQPVNGNQYLWYHRDTDDEPFFPLGEQQATMTATARGEFMVKVFSPACESFSPVVTIRNDSVELALNPLGRICSDASQVITLMATPAGGQWYGDGVSFGKLFTKSLSNGTHKLTYTYKSPHQCVYEESIYYQLYRIEAPILQRVSGNLCVDGTVNLRIQSPPQHNVSYFWLAKSDAGVLVTEMDPGETVSVHDRGIYQVVARDEQCAVTSNEINVGETSFPMEMLPPGQPVIACEQSPLNLTLNVNDQSSYAWYFAEDETAAGVLLAGQNSNTLRVGESGYYYAVVTSGICQQETIRKQVIVQPDGEIFVPNIITPNNDNRNDFFEVITEVDVVDYTISNRYGKTIFRSEKTGKWSGEGSSPGTYYWLVRYRACTGDIQTMKGFVQLMR